MNTKDNSEDTIIETGVAGMASLEGWGGISNDPSLIDPTHLEDKKGI